MQAFEVAAQNHALAIAKARRGDLLGMAIDYRQARTIRLFVAALLRRSSEADGARGEAFEEWCRWALAEADTIDPAKNFDRFCLPIRTRDAEFMWDLIWGDRQERRNYLAITIS